MCNLYWFKSFQREWEVWQRIIEKIMKASIQVMMSVISMTRFLDPGTASLSSNIVWKSVSQVYKQPCCNFRNNLIWDWSIARTHHKCFVEVWKRGGLRSSHATTRAPNHYRQVGGGHGGKSRDNRRTSK